ncbi:ABC transporter substrate-binding protein, partial [Limosilactobacillus fermentum]|uniref:ABC transporter substrate-binding protein n=1 Tax=Limosilactobacillus fermentum TaxID=1613 RepID=UPI00335F5B79
AALPTAVLTGPDYWGYDRSAFASAASAFTTKTDPARAKQLLAEAKPAKPIVIGIQGSSAVHEQTANVIQAAGKALGLDIRIKVIPVEQYGNLYSDPKARAGLDAFLTTFYGNVADPLDVYAVFAAGGPSNYGGY